MKNYKITPPLLLLMAAFILIDGTVFAVYAMLCALLHELAHILTLRLCRGRVRRVVTRGFGVSITTEPLSYGREATVAAAGPLCSLTLAVLFVLICRYAVFNEMTVFLAASNAALFAVNALPVYPLDGGRVLYCLLCLRLLPQKAAAVTRAVSVIFLLPTAALSVIILIKTGYNLSLFVICVYLAVLLMGVKVR